MRGWPKLSDMKQGEEVPRGEAVPVPPGTAALV